MGQARGRACVRAGTSATSSPPPPSRRGAATAAMAAECVPAAAGSANRLEPSDATTTCSRGRPPTSRRSAPGSQEPADFSAQIAISPPSGPYTSDAGAVSCAVHTSSPVYGWRRCSVLCGPARMPARRGRARVTARAPGRAPAARHVGRSWAARLRSLPAHAPWRRCFPGRLAREAALSSGRVGAPKPSACGRPARHRAEGCPLRRVHPTHAKLPADHRVRVHIQNRSQLNPALPRPWTSPSAA